MKSGLKLSITDFHVIQGSQKNLISYATAVEHGIVPVIKSVSCDESTSYADLCDKYKTVFTSLGKLKDKQLKFHMDENVLSRQLNPQDVLRFTCATKSRKNY